MQRLIKKPLRLNISTEDEFKIRGTTSIYLRLTAGLRGHFMPWRFNGRSRPCLLACAFGRLLGKVFSSGILLPCTSRQLSVRRDRDLLFFVVAFIKYAEIIPLSFPEVKKNFTGSSLGMPSAHLTKDGKGFKMSISIKAVTKRNGFPNFQRAGGRCEPVRRMLNVLWLLSRWFEGALHR